MLWGSEMEVSPPGGYMEDMGSGFAVSERRQHLGGGVRQADTALLPWGSGSKQSISRHQWRGETHGRSGVP